MGYTRPCRHARRRALHEALLPDRQGCRRSDAHLLRRARIRAAATSRDSRWKRWGFGKRIGRRLHRRWRPARRRERDRIRATTRSNFLRLFHVAQKHGLDIHPHALRLITQSLKLIDAELRDNPEANRLFIEILTSSKDPEIALRRMNEAGVFGRFVPDFGRVVAQMQYDMYHTYTVDEHTIFAIGILHRDRTRRAQGRAAARDGPHPDHRFAPRALSRGAAARHRQGPRRRPFGAGRGGRGKARAAPRLHRRGDRDRRLAGALASPDEQHRFQARHRRSQDDPRISSHRCNRPSG